MLNVTFHMDVRLVNKNFIRLSMDGQLPFPPTKETNFEFDYFDFEVETERVSYNVSEGRFHVDLGNSDAEEYAIDELFVKWLVDMRGHGWVPSLAESTAGLLGSFPTLRVVLPLLSKTERLSLPISHLGPLTQQLRKCLQRVNATTLGEVIRFSKADLLSIRGVGPGVLKELDVKLGRIGLKMDAEDHACPNCGLPAKGAETT